MSRHIWMALLVQLLLVPVALANSSSMAITAFSNNTGDQQFEPLGRGLADMLLTDLSHVEGLTLVERSRLNEILDELALSSSDFVDPETAAQAGRGVGARWVLTGGVSAVSPQMRLDARVIEVETSRIVAATETTGPQDEFFLLEKELAAEILAELGVSVTPRAAARMGKVQTESFPAFLAWSQGLEALDAGEVEEAAARLKEALEHDDRFALAEKALADLKDRLSVIESDRETLYTEEVQRVLTAIDEIADRGGPWEDLKPVVMPLMTQSFNLSADERRSIDKKLLGLDLPLDLFLVEGPGMNVSIHQWAQFDLVTISFQAGYRSDVLSWGEDFLRRYPTSMYHQAVRSNVEQVITRIEQENAGAGKRGEAVAWGVFEAGEMTCNFTKVPADRVVACGSWLEQGQPWGFVEGSDVEKWSKAAAAACDVGELEKAQSWASDHDYEVAAERAGRLRDVLQRDISAVEGLDWRAKLEDSEQTSRWARLADDFADAGELKTAYKILELGQTQQPEVLGVWEKMWRIAAATGDEERLRQTIEGARAAGHKVRGGETALEQVERDNNYVAQVPGEALRETAIRMSSYHQYALAAEYWERLAREAPEYEWCAQPCALFAAAGAIQRALVERQNEKARALYAEIVEKHPDSQQAETSRTVMRMLPR